MDSKSSGPKGSAGTSAFRSNARNLASISHVTHAMEANPLLRQPKLGGLSAGARSLEHLRRPPRDCRPRRVDGMPPWLVSATRS